jgi:hypothetical protein
MIKGPAATFLASTFCVLAQLGIGVAQAYEAPYKLENDPVVVSLRRVVAGNVARISYAATCRDARGVETAPQMAAVNLQEPPPGETGFAAVQPMFQSDQSVVVTQDPQGIRIIRIRIGEFPDTILQTRMSQLNFTPSEQYNVVFAILAIFKNEDMRSAMQRLGLRQPLYIYNGVMIPPAPGLPHLPEWMNDVTLDQVLDMIATTFRGIVAYGMCTDSGMFDVEFIRY